MLLSLIDSLLTSAKELVGIAERLKKVNKSNEENSEFNDYLLQMGISSPVTKNSAGASFHSELARQLSEFVCAYLKHEKTFMIPLTDLFCVFNRARGTEMISPDDLLRAASLLADLKLPVISEQFSSGVIVVKLASYTREAINKKIQEQIASSEKLKEFDFAQKERISLGVAHEQLINAENDGIICRDETQDGLTFYANIFNDEYEKLLERRPEWKLS